MATEADLGFWVGVWAAVALYLIARHWRTGAGVGLLLTYVLSYGSIHWLAATIHLLPWFVNRYTDTVAEGMRQSAIGILALAAGAEVMALIVRRRRPMPVQVRGPQAPDVAQPTGESMVTLDPRTLRFVLLSGLAIYGVLSPLGAAIPGAQALVATGSAITVMAVALHVWNAWYSRHWWSARGWLAATMALPVVTVISQGFLGYGMAAMLTVYAFVAAFVRPRWKVVALGLVFAYAGLSVYITYMRDRNDIRSMVWGGSSLTARASQIADTFAGMEWFDPYNQSHLNRVDTRLNQDYLVGAAVQRLEGGFVPYAGGSTLSDAIVAVVPRALWPDKPVVAGSGNLMATYTGMRFAEGTSVGIGQVLECYINFGTAGVIVGFFVIGLLLVLIDHSAYVALEAGDVFRFARWYLPGLGLLQVGGSFAEVTSTAGAGLVVALLLRELATRFLPARPDSIGADGLAPVHQRQP
jgi:hypothetical protein